MKKTNYKTLTKEEKLDLLSKELSMIEKAIDKFINKSYKLRSLETNINLLVKNEINKLSEDSSIYKGSLYKFVDEDD